MGRVDELIYGSLENKWMHEVMGRTDELIHCSGMGRDDDLVQRQRGESG